MNIFKVPITRSKKLLYSEMVLKIRKPFEIFLFKFVYYFFFFFFIFPNYICTKVGEQTTRALGWQESFFSSPEDLAAHSLPLTIDFPSRFGGAAEEAKRSMR